MRIGIDACCWSNRRGFGRFTQELVTHMVAEFPGHSFQLVVDQKTAEIRIPVAVTVFPGEIYQAPRSWTERAYPKLIYFNEVDKGRHFAAWEQPELFAAELRAAFRSLR